MTYWHPSLPMPTSAALLARKASSHSLPARPSTFAAIQFTVGETNRARQDYFTPSQCQLIMMGVFLLFIALESVICFYVHEWNQLKQKRKVRP